MCSIASGALDRVDNPVAWLSRSARNAVIDHYRTRRTHASILGEDRWPDPDSAAELPNDATRELSRCLQPMLDQLTSAARDALMRVDVDGEPHHRVAADPLSFSFGNSARTFRAVASGGESERTGSDQQEAAEDVHGPDPDAIRE